MMIENDQYILSNLYHHKVQSFYITFDIWNIYFNYFLTKPIFEQISKLHQFHLIHKAKTQLK